VLPFAALRYVAPSAELPRLISPPYDVISSAEQAELRALSACNVVYVELPLDRPGEAGSRYVDAACRLSQWRAEGVIQADSQPAYYLTETEFSNGFERYRRRDVVAALVTDPWSTGTTLPHEQTMAGPKVDRLELLRATHLNASAIWVMHRDPVAAVASAWIDADARPPVADFTWRGERHRVWVVDDPVTVEAIRLAFENGPPLYIADGHHRYETSLAFNSEMDGRLPGAGAIMASVCWAGDPGLVVLPTHRLLHGLDPSFTLEEAEARWADAFHIEYYPVWEGAPAEQVAALMQQLASSGRSAPSIGLYGLGDPTLFAVLELRGRKAPPGSLPAERSEAWRSLDVSLLHALLVDSLVAETGRPREQVLSYERDPLLAIKAVRDGAASCAFFLNPTPVSSVLAVADAHDRMPEKSTYFYPKPPAGLVMRDLERVT
jgi:uncharacterized protein (DUF1015 family)